MSPPRKADITIGFGNALGDAAAAIAKADCDAISPLFARLHAPPAGRIPRTAILFLYAKLAPDGRLQGFDGGVQKFAAGTQTKLLVLAAENAAESIVKAGSIKETPYANVVFTNRRNGTGFSRFFHDMFKRMLQDGSGIGPAYASLAPQGVPHATWLPGTIFVMAAGDLRLPST